VSVTSITSPSLRPPSITLKTVPSIIEVTLIFRSGAYALYYREMSDCWLVAGGFHAQRDPDWIQTQFLIRESRETGS
jgi:hypothetical protein